MATLKPNTDYTYTIKLGCLDDLRASADIVIGGSDPTKLLPIVNSSKWKDEAWLALNPKWIIIGAEQHTFEANKIELTVGDITWFSYPLNDDVLEVGFKFASKPKFSEIVLDITDSGNLQYNYQDTLENDFKTQAPKGMTLEKFLSQHERPDNVVGSYAVKVIGKRNNEYRTGKFAHLYRWEVIDADGKKAWCDPLRIENGQLIIGLPEQFIEIARYPITCMGAGDTFGWDGAGDSSYQALESECLYCFGVWSPEFDGTLDDINALLRVDAQHSFTFGVYNESGNEATTLVAVTAGGDVPTGSKIWRSQDFNDEAILAANDYFFAINHEDVETSRVFYDSNSGYGGYDNGIDYSEGSLPSPVAEWGTLATGRDTCIYCNYTPGAGGRTTKNTDAFPLGQNYGMSYRM